MLAALSALLPVVLLTALGTLVGHLKWVGAPAAKDLSNLVFLVLTPALLFRTMSRLAPGEISLAPAAVYFGACVAIFLVALLLRGWNREAAVQGLAATFGNTLMVGVPVVSLAYGEAGLTHLFPLLSLHALVLLTLATLALELAPGEGATPRNRLRTVMQAMRNALLHPALLPVLAGLGWAQTGWIVPGPIDTALWLLGQALGPLSLLLVGISLAHSPVAAQWRGSLALALVKTAVHPLVVWGVGVAAGLAALPLAVVVVTACLPMGANVFLFAQRYGVIEDRVTAAVALSCFTALVSLTITLMLLAPSA